MFFHNIYRLVNYSISFLYSIENTKIFYLIQAVFTIEFTHSTYGLLLFSAKKRRMKTNQGGTHMDNEKMGNIIREARKKKGLTQKDIATHLNITDRAVSKWERGICAPDLALLEPLANILGVTITELIAGEKQTNDANKKELEQAVKETIQYSKQENANKKKNNRKKIVIIIVASLLLLTTLNLFLLHKGFFHKIGTYSSPDGTTVATVYSCHLHRDGFPTTDGFTVECKGHWNGRTHYINSVFKGMWWSPDSNYRVISMYMDNEPYLELVDYKRNSACNLTHYLERALYKNEFFSDVPYDEEGWRPQIIFEFIQWSTEDPSVMLVYFSYNDAQHQFHEGYMWYDYESGHSSGEMELEQGEKDIYWLHEIFDSIK